MKKPLFTVSASAPTLPEALTGVLTQIVARLGSPPAAGDVPTRTATIRAEAATIDDLLPALTASLAGVLADFAAAPITVAIDGLRQLEGGVRAWGSVTLGLVPFGAEPDIEWLEPPTIRQAGEAWHINGMAGIVTQSQR